MGHDRRFILLLAFASACVGDPASLPPPTGMLDITATTTGYALEFPPSYYLCVDEPVNCNSVSINATTTVPDLAVGEHRAELHVAPWCTVNSGNPQTVQILEAQTASVSFAVTCAALTGLIEVTVSTSGPDSTPYLYVAHLRTPGGVERECVSQSFPSCVVRTGGSVLLTYVPAGDHLVTLDGVPANCRVGPPDTVSVTIMPGDTSHVTFALNCDAPSGDRLAVSGFLLGGYASGLFSIHADGTGLALLDSTPPNGFDWAPDGTRIAFSGQHNGRSAIYVVQANGLGKTQVTNSPGRDDWSPVWSPDGLRIAFVSGVLAGGADIIVVDAAGTNPVNLTRGTSAFPRDPVWSPDGTRVAFVVWDSVGHQDIHIANADGSGTVNLTNATGVDQSPAWSPEGTRIAFESDRSGSSGVYVITADGTGLVYLNPGHSPTWSPDGMRVAFGCNSLCTVNPDGSGLVRLGPSPASSPQWSPNGLEIAFLYFTTSYPFIGVLYAIGVDGGSPRLLSPSFVSISAVRWNPNP